MWQDLICWVRPEEDLQTLAQCGHGNWVVLKEQRFRGIVGFGRGEGMGGSKQEL